MFVVCVFMCLYLYLLTAVACVAECSFALQSRLVSIMVARSSMLLRVSCPCVLGLVSLQFTAACAFVCVFLCAKSSLRHVCVHTCGVCEAVQCCVFSQRR